MNFDSSTDEEIQLLTLYEKFYEVLPNKKNLNIENVLVFQLLKAASSAKLHVIPCEQRQAPFPLWEPRATDGSCPSSSLFSWLLTALLCCSSKQSVAHLHAWKWILVQAFSFTALCQYMVSWIWPGTNLHDQPNSWHFWELIPPLPHQSPGLVKVKPGVTFNTQSLVWKWS